MVSIPRQRSWLCLLAGVLLLGSWLGGPLRPLWDGIDELVFRLTNPLLGQQPLWDSAWALANHRATDLIAAVTMAAIFALSGRYDQRRDGAELLVRALVGALLGLASKALTGHLLDLNRLSPTLEFRDSQRLSLLVPWVDAKDASKGSFPSDHGLVLPCLTLYGWRQLLPAARWAVVLASLLFSLPRLFSGAHWLSDTLAGSLPLALISVGLLGVLVLDRLLERRLLPPLSGLLRGLLPAGLRRCLQGPIPQESDASA
jgi:membrane-associated phospholipid phosphatase